MYVVTSPVSSVHVFLSGDLNAHELLHACLRAYVVTPLVSSVYVVLNFDFNNYELMHASIRR